jgi:hypothetical protein
MTVKHMREPAGTLRRSLIGAVMVLSLGATGVEAQAAETTLKAEYLITIAGLTIGKADAEGRFTDNGYAATISGATYGISRFVSNAKAVLTGNGLIRGTNVVPATYNLDTNEKGFKTHVDMEMRSGSIVDLTAAPDLLPAPDRVPVTAGHTHNVLDPVGAFVVALNRTGPGIGPTACNRTVRVFDGWQRYDVKLTFKKAKHVVGGPGAYSGEVFVCGARYVPVAGHRAERDSVKYMADNKRLEVQLVPIAGTRLMVPYRITIGTKMGDLVILSRDFSVTAGRQAQAD